MEERKGFHLPVLLNEVLALLSPTDGGVYFDGTFGGGGYSRAILDSCSCQLIACDRDATVIPIADQVSQKYGDKFSFSHSKFSDIKLQLREHHNATKLDGLLLDLGLSSFQLSDPARGFSFGLSGPVRMTMGLNDETAMDVIRRYSEKQLADIIYKFGEEYFSRRIAKNIKIHLAQIKNTEDLANIIRKSIRSRGKIDPATKTFQALRIFVNDELGELEKILEDATQLLNPAGKIIVVSFHSLEDRIVKFFFKKLCTEKRGLLLTKKPIVPSPAELLSNPRSRSAKLRGFCVL
ncbi:MAG: 16S rRNA (cytosine(1402)-N(4))-methyltransferase RsmH [Holosporaceae bacterium]|jgi:16S rRNA (cytosine1402-N4)-methyltransferase|nr:16S rRNA (cytosine(1402)-N(4))-methyltransferase RsmH [Holosporaceae bacterium]